MSIATSTAKVQYTISSTTQALPVPFYFLEDAHVKAIRSRADTADYDMVKGTDYTLTGAADEDGGTLTLIATNMTIGDVVTIKRDISITQEVNYVYNDRFPAETHEKALDKLSMIAQQDREELERAIRFPESEPAATVSVLALAEDRAAKILGFDPDGAIQLYDPVAGVFTEGAGIEVGSIAALKAVSVTTLTTGYQAQVGGYYTPGDKGNGLFVYNSASAATDNGGTVIAPKAGSGRWLRVYDGAVNVRWFGAKGDNATDDAASIQAAVDFLASTGGELYFPTGRYVCEAAVLLPVTDYLLTFTGDSYRTSVLVSNIVSASATALLRGDGVIGTRCYFSARNIGLEGDGAANVHGLFLQYGTPFSELSDLFISGFIDGIRLANIYRMNLRNIHSIQNVNNVVVGMNLAGAGAVCNAISIIGGRQDSASGKGIYINGCRNITITGGDVENCGTHGLHAEYVFGLTVNSLYSEASLVTHNTVAHYLLENCRGVTMNACNVSNWYAGNILVKIAGSSGVVLNSMNCELGIGSVVTRAGTAVAINASQGVVCNSCQWANIANGVTVTTNGRVMLNYCYFLDYVTVPLTLPDENYSNAIWNGAYAADIAASTIGSAARLIAQLQEGTTTRQNWTD